MILSLYAIFVVSFLLALLGINEIKVEDEDNE